jgi:hypothetical protein
VAERLVERGQVMITVADEGQVPAQAAQVWDVADGQVALRVQGGNR